MASIPLTDTPLSADQQPNLKVGGMAEAASLHKFSAREAAELKGETLPSRVQHRHALMLPGVDRKLHRLNLLPLRSHLRQCWQTCQRDNGIGDSAVQVCTSLLVSFCTIVVQLRGCDGSVRDGGCAGVGVGNASSGGHDGACIEPQRGDLAKPRPTAHMR